MREPEETIGQELLEKAPQDWEKLRLYSTNSESSFGLTAFAFREDGTFYNFSFRHSNNFYRAYWALKKQFQSAGHPMFTWFIFTVNKDLTFEIEYGYNPIESLEQIAPNPWQ